MNSSSVSGSNLEVFQHLANIFFLRTVALVFVTAIAIRRIKPLQQPRAAKPNVYEMLARERHRRFPRL